MFFCNNQLIARAETNFNYDEIEQELFDNIKQQLDKLSFTNLDKFVLSVDKNIGKLFSNNIKELVYKIISGEFIINFDDFVNFIFYQLKSVFTKYIPFVFLIIFIAISSSILNGMTSGFIKKPTVDIINLVCYFSIIIVIFTALSYVIIDVKSTINNIKNLMDISFPILLTLLLALGGAKSGSMFKPLMLVLSNFIVSTIVGVIIPFFIASLVLSVVGNMSNAVKITKLPKFFTSISTWILGTMFSLFSGFVTIKGISGIMIDNVSISAAKFCLSSYVPILGGYVSDGFDLVLASLLLIKNSLGIVVLILLILITIVPVIKVVFFILSLKLISAVIEPIADSKIVNLLEGISSNLIVLISCLVGLSFMFFIMMLLIIKSLSYAI